MRVSVVLPFYNGALYLEEALQSTLHSTLKEFELVLVDDGSCDGSLAIAQKYASLDERVKLFSQDNRGIAHALNYGISQSKGEYIARMDGDDIMAFDRLLRQKEFLDRTLDVGLVSCCVEPLLEGDLTEGSSRYFAWLNRTLSNDAIQKELYHESPLPHPSVMFRRSLLKKVGGYREYEGPEDYDLWLRFQQVGAEFHKIAAPLLQWRVHDASLSRSDMFHYGDDAFLVRKIAHIIETLQKSPSSKIRICGTGKNGRLLAKSLQGVGFFVDAFVDVSPKKIGKLIDRVSVIGFDAVGTNESYIYLSMVGRWGAREMVREFLLSKKKRERVDFYLL